MADQRKITDKEVYRLYFLSGQNLTYKKIAEIRGCHPSYVGSIIRKKCWEYFFEGHGPREKPPQSSEERYDPTLPDPWDGIVGIYL
jgi:uncharacterized protein YjcR